MLLALMLPLGSPRLATSAKRVASAGMTERSHQVPADVGWTEVARFLARYFFRQALLL